MGKKQTKVTHEQGVMYRKCPKSIHDKLDM